MALFSGRQPFWSAWAQVKNFFAGAPVAALKLRDIEVDFVAKANPPHAFVEVTVDNTNGGEARNCHLVIEVRSDWEGPNGTKRVGPTVLLSTENRMINPRIEPYIRPDPSQDEEVAFDAPPNLPSFSVTGQIERNKQYATSFVQTDPYEGKAWINCEGGVSTLRVPVELDFDMKRWR